MDSPKSKPSLEINSRKVNGVTVLDLHGRMTSGDGSGVFQDVIEDLVERKDFKTVLNMADVSFVDHSGIGELVAAYTAASNHGGDLKLTNLTPKMKNLLEITKLDAIFDIQPDESAAIKAFDQKSTGFAAQEQERRTETPGRGKGA